MVLDVIVHVVRSEQKGLPARKNRPRVLSLIRVRLISGVLGDTADAKKNLKPRHRRENPKEEIEPAVAGRKENSPQSQVHGQNGGGQSQNRNAFSGALIAQLTGTDRLLGDRGFRFRFAGHVNEIANEFEVGNPEGVASELARETRLRDRIAADQTQIRIIGRQRLAVVFQMKLLIGIHREKKRSRAKDLTDHIVPEK